MNGRNQKAGRAAGGLKAFSDGLASENPQFAEGLDLERAADEFCDSIRTTLKHLRKAGGIDQAALAQAMSLTQSAVSRLETARGDIGLKTIFRYARALGQFPSLSFAPAAIAGDAAESVPVRQVAASLNELQTHLAEVIEVLEQAVEAAPAGVEEEAVAYAGDS
jgi:transcriptional regulator with XRE-family HTH domain